MLESAEIGHKVSKAAYAREEPRLREALLNAQYDLAQSGRGPVLLIISGVEGGGRGETANQLTAWMDPRHIRVIAFGPRTPEEEARPPAWRYWRALPAKGKVGIFMNAWYSEMLAARLRGKIDDGELHLRMAAIRQHERMLTDEGVDPAQVLDPPVEGRPEAAARASSTATRAPAGASRATTGPARASTPSRTTCGNTCCGRPPPAKRRGRRRGHRRAIPQPVGRQDPARGHAADTRREEVIPSPKHAPTPTAPAVIDNVKLIRDLDLTKKVSPKEYERGVERFQGKLAKLTRNKRFADHSLVLVFEGADAAGKGGAIRRVTAALDARQYVTVPIAAPTDEERVHPYLWRFWRQVPPRGGIVIFDRSWYGRVLVERVEGLLRGHRLDARLRRDQPVRGAADHGRRGRREVLAADQRGRAASPLPGAREDGLQAFQDHGRGLAQPHEVECLRSGAGRRRRSHQHRNRAVDAGRGRGQALCAAQDPEDDRRGGSRRRLAERAVAARTRAGNFGADRRDLSEPARGSRAATCRPSGRTCCAVPPCPSGASASTRPTATSGTSTGSTPAGARAGAPLVVLFHGLEGSSDSHYARALLRGARRARLARRGAPFSRLQRGTEPAAARLSLRRPRGSAGDAGRDPRPRRAADRRLRGRRVGRRQRAAQLAGARGPRCGARRRRGGRGVHAARPHRRGRRDRPGPEPDLHAQFPEHAEAEEPRAWRSAFRACSTRPGSGARARCTSSTMP